MLNNVTIMGRITKDLELKNTASGTAYVKFSLAVERDRKDRQTGEKVTDFIDFIAWSGTAEFISKFFGKGRMMVVEGRIETSQFADKDGNKRKSVAIVVENAYFGDSKRDAQAGSDGFVDVTGDDDDLPF